MEELKNTTALLADSIQTLSLISVENLMRRCGFGEEDLNIANKFAAIFLAYKYSEFESFEDTVNYIQKNFVDAFTKEKLLKTLEKFCKAVDELSRIYQRKELRQALFNWQVRNYDDRNFKDVPDGIGKLAAGLLDIKDGEKVLNLNSSTFKWAVNIADNEKIFVCGVDESQDAVFIGNIRAALVNNRLNVKFVDALNENFTNIQADKVFVNYIGGRIHPRNIFNVELKNFGENILCKEWAYTVLGMLNQKSGGKTVALLPDNVLTNAADKETRKKLLEGGKIEGVIALHTFGGGQKNLLILSNNNNSVKMLDARKFFYDGAGEPVLNDRFVEKILRQYNSESENFIEVSNAKVAENNFALYPPRYLTEKKINFKSRPLSDFVKSIQRGAQQLRPHELSEMKSAVPTNYQLLNIQDITENGINENLTYLKEDAFKKYDTKFLSAGDIVISKLFPFKVALIPDTKKKIIVSGNLYVLKVAADVNPLWQLLCLKNPQISFQLNAMAVGKSISSNNLREIKIPQTSPDEQNELAEKYSLLLKELENLAQEREKICEKNKKFDKYVENFNAERY